MTIDEATLKTFEIYKGLLEDKGVISKDHSEDEWAKLTPFQKKQHLLWMCNRILSKETKHYSLDKQSRWLGFVQYGLIDMGFTTISQERNRTRPWFTGAK